MKFTIVSEGSVEPKCRHFRICGGCQFQHIPYDEQLAHKEAFVSQCFGRKVESILPCEPAWRYRNKMEFSFAQSKSGEKFLGLMKRRGRVENLEECFLTHPWFIEILKKVREWWQKSDLNAYHPPTNQGVLRTLIVRRGIHSGETMVVLTLSEEPFNEEALTTFVESLPLVDALILRRQIIRKKIPTRFEERVLRGRNHIHEKIHDAQMRPYLFRIRAASFFQPNTIQAETIYQKVMEYGDWKNSEHILDLYCGTGSLGIFASRHVERVHGIELINEAVEDAQVNLALNNVTNMEILEGDVAERLGDFSFHPTSIIIDPPRAGLGPKTIACLHRLNAEKIIYVSCNPVTQAADCQALGYAITHLQPIDQFPHTPHIENIALLTRGHS